MANSIFIQPFGGTVQGDIAVTGVVLTGDGSQSAPARSYIADPDTGPYRVGTNNEGFSAGGALRWDYNTTRISSTLPIIINGSNKTDPLSVKGNGATVATISIHATSSADADTFVVYDNGTVQLAGLSAVGSQVTVFSPLVLSSTLRISGVVMSPTAPTIASGFGASPSIVASNGTAAFTVNVGTGGAASSGVITMPAATTGWACSVMNLTALAANRADQRTVQTATTTTSVTVQNQTISTGAALAWTASDVLLILAVGY